MAVKTFTSGEVLTASDTNTYLNNGGLVYITAGTASAAATLSVNSCFTATYENYFVTWNGLTSANDVVMNIRFRASGTDASTGYRYVQLQSYVGLGSPSISGSNTATVIQAGGSSNQQTSFEAWLYNPQLAKYTLARGTSTNIQSGGTIDTYTFSGFLYNTTAYDGITVYPASGTLTGTLRVYGLRIA